MHADDPNLIRRCGQPAESVCNPLEDIRNTQDIWRVIKGGQLYDPATLRPGIEVPQKKAHLDRPGGP